MKIILTGATGFSGGEVLDQLIADHEIKNITVLTRRPLGKKYPKVKEIIHQNFLDYSNVASDLNADACIWCLGISQTEVTPEEYIKITVDYAVAAEKALLKENPNVRFCFLSGRGADQSEQSSVLFRKIKGRTEKELSKLSVNVFSFQPGFIKPSGPHQKRPLVPMLFLPIAWIVDRFTETFSINVATLAHCMIEVAKHGSNRKIFTNQQMLHFQKQEQA